MQLRIFWVWKRQKSVPFKEVNFTGHLRPTGISDYAKSSRIYIFNFFCNFTKKIKTQKITRWEGSKLQKIKWQMQLIRLDFSFRIFCAKTLEPLFAYKSGLRRVSLHTYLKHCFSKKYLLSISFAVDDAALLLYSFMRNVKLTWKWNHSNKL